MPLQAQLRRKLQGHEDLEEQREGGNPQKKKQIFYPETAKNGKGYPKSACPHPPATQTSGHSERRVVCP